MADILKTDDNEAAEELIAPEEDVEILTVDEAAGEEEQPFRRYRQEQEEPIKRKQSLFADLFDSFETFCHALVLMMIIFAFVLRFVTVDGGSMNNTLTDGDKLIISDLFYTPETGDIVVLDAEGMLNEKYIIKRVVATGGQKVEINYAEWKVTVDGVVLQEDYVLKTAGKMNHGYFGNRQEISFDKDGNVSFTVPDGMLFVMGDNRNNSSDSRTVGFFEEERLLGRVLMRVSPMSGDLPGRCVNH